MTPEEVPEEQVAFQLEHAEFVLAMWTINDGIARMKELLGSIEKMIEENKETE
jgi:hypothetical protein